jgi:hypothetical protein
VKLQTQGTRDDTERRLFRLLLIGTWGLGLGTRRANLSKVPLGTDAETWIMDQYGQVKHDNKVLSQFRTAIEEGDVVVSIPCVSSTALLGERA